MFHLQIVHATHINNTFQWANTVNAESQVHTNNNRKTTTRINQVKITIINMLSIIDQRELLVDVKMDCRLGIQTEMLLSEMKENKLTWEMREDKLVDQVKKGRTNHPTNTTYTTK